MLFIDIMVIHIEYTKNFLKKYIRISSVNLLDISAQKSIAFIFTTIEKLEK